MLFTPLYNIYSIAKGDLYSNFKGDSGIMTPTKSHLIHVLDVSETFLCNVLFFVALT